MMESRLTRLLLLSLQLCCVIITIADAINITGNVKSSAGVPLSGATLKLKVDGTSAISDANGNYAIISTSVKHMSTLFSMAGTAAIRGNSLELWLERSGAVSIEIYELSGVVSSTVIHHRQFAPGFHRIPFPVRAMSPGVYVVQIRIGAHETNLEYSPGGQRSANLKMGADLAAAVSAKLPVAFSDVLLCQRAGFKPDSLVVTDPNGVYNFTISPAASFGPGMKLITGGTFTMGSDKSVNVNAKPAHQVTVSSFYMDTTDVTQAQYSAVMGVNPSHFTASQNNPVESETWYDAILYCNARSKKDGRDTVYVFGTISGTAGKGCTGLANLAYSFSKNGYRLPTEAEWEYACRAGTITDFFWGNDTTAVTVGQYCWYYGNSNNSTHPVATKKPNPWGLYDMGGNVWQWCNDYYAAYAAGASTDPVGPSTGSYRALRGAGYNLDNGLIYISSAGRDPGNDPGTSTDRRGFRCVRR